MARSDRVGSPSVGAEVATLERRYARAVDKLDGVPLATAKDADKLLDDLDEFRKQVSNLRAVAIKACNDAGMTYEELADDLGGRSISLIQQLVRQARQAEEEGWVP